MRRPDALVRLHGPIGSPASRQLVGRVQAELRDESVVKQVDTYYGTHNPAMVSRDGRWTWLGVYFRPMSDKTRQDAAKRIAKQFDGTPGVILGGSAIAQQQVNTQVQKDLARAEMLAFPLLFLLSLWFFRSLVAALLPPLLGGLAIVMTFAALRIVGSVVDVSVFALNLTTGLGLGLAIDYSLFIVSRYREELARGLAPAQAVRVTLQTAGRAVVFSSLTVAAALAALIVFPQRFLYSMGIGGLLVTLIASASAVIVLPASSSRRSTRACWAASTALARPAICWRRSSRPTRARRSGWSSTLRLGLPRLTPCQRVRGSSAVPHSSRRPSRSALTGRPSR